MSMSRYLMLLAAVILAGGVTALAAALAGPGFGPGAAGASMVAMVAWLLLFLWRR